jgi:tetratricopeptide (TPR) repeat protein
VVAGKILCRACRDEAEKALPEFEKQAAKRINCAQCGRAISAKEIADRKITIWKGRVLCAICTRDPAIVLRGKASVAKPGECRVCSAAIVPGTLGECAKCQDELRQVAEATMSGSAELAKANPTYPCSVQGCTAALTPNDVRAGKAALTLGKIYCLAHVPAAEGVAADKKAPVRCARCKKLLEGAGAKHGDMCLICQASAAEDGERTSAALALGNVALKCWTCHEGVPQADLAAGHAAFIEDRLICRSCRAKGATATTKGAAGAVRLCSTCDQPLGPTPFKYLEKEFCAGCKVELDAILAAAKIPPPEGAKCSTCKKPATGPGTLNLGAEIVCGSGTCTRAAQFLLQSRVRDRRAKKSQASLGKFAAAAGVTVMFGLILSQLASSGPTTKQPLIAVQPPAPGSAQLAKAYAIVSRPTTSYEDAIRALIELAPIEEELRAIPECETPLGEIHKRALARRDSYAPKLAAEVLNQAALAFGDGDRPDKVTPAKAALAKFPEPLADTPSGIEVRTAAARYDAFGACCRSPGIYDPDPAERAAGIARVFASREAQICDFPKTAFGKKLADDQRLLENRLLAEQDRATKNPGGAKANAADVKVALALEAKKDFDGAEALYRKILARDPESWDALMGLARSALEHNRLAEARALGEHALLIDSKSNPARVVAAWLQYTDSKPDGHARATATLKGIPEKELGVPGKRLKAFLDLGPPKFEGKALRWYGRGVVNSPDLGVAKNLEGAIATAATILGLDADTLRATIVVLPKPAYDDLVRKLELGGPLADAPSSCYVVVAPAGITLEKLRRYITISLALRRPDGPPWVRGALPIVLEGIVMPRGSYPLAQFDRVELSKFMTTPKLEASAIRYCSVLTTEGGTAALSLYVAHYTKDPEKAREELERNLAKLGYKP